MWRLRVLIETEVILETGTHIIGDISFLIFEVNSTNMQNGDSIPANLRYFDVTWDSQENDINEAFSKLYDETQKFLDKVSLASYGRSAINNIISISPREVKANQTFEIAFPQFTQNRTTLTLKLKDLGSVSLQPVHDRWLRLLRLGLNSQSEEEKYISFYSLLEEIAREESNITIKNKCGNCDHEVDTGRKATNNYIRDILKSHNLENKLIKKSVSLRNKIAHGGAEKNKTFYRDIALLNSHFEEVCLLELEKRLDIGIVNRLNSHITDLPIVKHSCLCQPDGSFQLIESSLTFPARFVKLHHESEDAFKGQTATIGMAMNGGAPVINPFSWPEIIT